MTVGSVEPFDGNGTYTSEDVTVTEAGYYTWVAYYDSGDGNNVDATHACGQAVETTLVNPAEPAITTDADQDEVTLSDQPTVLSDTANLTGATGNATGSVSFSLYGPFDTDPGADSCVEGTLVDDGRLGGAPSTATAPTRPRT